MSEHDHYASIAAQTYTASQYGTKLADTYGELSVERQDIGEIFCPTGRIVACDPFTFANPQPFEQTVPPGRYPVTLGIANWGKDERIAVAILRVKDEQPVQWKMATLEGQNLNDLADNGIFGYPIDSGTGSFMDFESALVLERKLDDQAYFQVVSQLMRKNYQATREWATVMLDEASGLNCALFSSGLGDGVYASYWGYDSLGEVVCLMTDFVLLIKDE